MTEKEEDKDRPQPKKKESYIEKHKMLLLVQEQEASPMDSPLTESGQWTESGISTGSAAEGHRPKAEKPRDLDIGGSKGESGASKATDDRSIDTDAEMSPMNNEAVEAEAAPLEESQGSEELDSIQMMRPERGQVAQGGLDKETDVQSLNPTADANLSPILFTQSKATSPMSGVTMLDASSSPPQMAAVQSAATSPPRPGDLESSVSPSSVGAEEEKGALLQLERAGSFEFEMDSSRSSEPPLAAVAGGADEGIGAEISEVSEHLAKVGAEESIVKVSLMKEQFEQKMEAGKEAVAERKESPEMGDQKEPEKGAEEQSSSSSDEDDHKPGASGEKVKVSAVGEDEVEKVIKSILDGKSQVVQVEISKEHQVEVESKTIKVIEETATIELKDGAETYDDKMSTTTISMEVGASSPEKKLSGDEAEGHSALIELASPLAKTGTTEDVMVVSMTPEHKEKKNGHIQEEVTEKELGTVSQKQAEMKAKDGLTPEKVTSVDVKETAEPDDDKVSTTKASMEVGATALEEKLSSDEADGHPTLTALASSLVKTGTTEDVKVVLSTQEQEEEMKGQIETKVVEIEHGAVSQKHDEMEAQDDLSPENTVLVEVREMAEPDDDKITTTKASMEVEATSLEEKLYRDEDDGHPTLTALASSLAKTGTTEDVMVVLRTQEQEGERKGQIETKIVEIEIEPESQKKVEVKTKDEVSPEDSIESKPDIRQSKVIEEVTSVEVKETAEPDEDKISMAKSPTDGSSAPEATMLFEAQSVEAALRIESREQFETEAKPIKAGDVTIDREQLKLEVLQQPKPVAAEVKLPRSEGKKAALSESDSDAEIERLGIEMPVKVLAKAASEGNVETEEGVDKESDETQPKKTVERDASTDSVDEMMVVVMPPGRTREEVDSSEQKFDEVSAPRIVVTPTPDDEKIEEGVEEGEGVADVGDPIAEEVEETLVEEAVETEESAVDVSKERKSVQSPEDEDEDEDGCLPTLTAMASSLAKTGATDNVLIPRTPEQSPEKEHEERWVTEKEVTMHEDVLTITETTRHEVQVAPCVVTETITGIEALDKNPMEIREPPVKQLSGEDEEQEESGLEIIEAPDSQVDQGTDATSDRTDSLLKESAMQGSFTSDRTLSEPTLEADVVEISQQTLLAEQETATERVTSTAEAMPRLEVESKARDAEDESETASVRTVEVKLEDEGDEFKEESPNEVDAGEAKDELPLLTALSSALTKTSAAQKEEPEPEQSEVPSAEVVQFSPMLSWTTEQTAAESMSISDRFPATRYGTRPAAAAEEGTDPTPTKHLVFEESTTSSSSSKTTTTTTSSSERSGTQSSIESHTTTTSRGSMSTDQSSVIATSSGKSSSPSGGPGPMSVSSPRASSVATTGSGKDVEEEELQQKESEDVGGDREEGSPRLSPRSDPGSHDLPSSPRSEEAAARDEPVRKSTSPPLRTRTTALSSEESVQSLPASPRRARKAKKMVMTSEHFSTDSDLSRSLEIVYNQPEEDARRKLSERFSHSSGDSDSGGGSREDKLAKRKASVTQLGSRKASTSESAADQYELQHKRPKEEGAAPRSSPPSGKKTPSPTKIVHPVTAGLIREQVSEDHLSPVLDVNVLTPEELDTSKYRIELVKAAAEGDGAAGKLGQGQSQVPPGLVADSPGLIFLFLASNVSLLFLFMPLTLTLSNNITSFL